MPIGSQSPVEHGAVVADPTARCVKMRGMSLPPGTRIGPYVIDSLLGMGGMGAVYRARDAKLNRDVAIKVLLPSVVGDPDRIARFRREAQVLASLNHPNIAHIHGVEDSESLTALVLELVEGEDLAQRISRSPLPVGEALDIARQVAQALEAAHDIGIIHRDLKPANIKVRSDGMVKVLDFGLAKAVGRDVGANLTAMKSPTLSIHETQTGMILGTAAYMSPEQAAGKNVDKRSDLWSFGTVLMEMLTGRQLFRGETMAHVLAAVLKEEPDWTTLPTDTPAPIRRLLRRCLEKDPKRRIADAADARLEIDDAPLSANRDGALFAGPIQQTTWRRALPWVGGAALASAVLVALWAPWRTASIQAPVRLRAELGTDASLPKSAVGAAVTLSPDGAVIAFIAQKQQSGSPQIYLRRLSELQATSLSGTDDAQSPFFSPDGEWIAFFAGNKLKKIAVTGGPVFTICDAPNGRGGTWGEDGTIVLSPNNATPGTTLVRVSSEGGTPQPLTTLAEGEVTHRWPQLLPGGAAVLFTISNSYSDGAFDDARIAVQPLPTGAPKVVQREGYHGRYVPSGHLVYMHKGTLFAARFDVNRLEVTGPAVPALDGVASDPSTGGAQFAVSGTGTLAYLPGESTRSGVPIQWMDETGNATSLRAAPADWFNPAFDPDGQRVALNILDGQFDIWVYDWARDTLARITADPASDTKPVWTPDGHGIVFASARADKATPNLYWQQADGIGDAQRLTESRNPQWPASWHPAGKFLLFEEQTAQTNYDVMLLPMEGSATGQSTVGKPTALLNGPGEEREPMFSPDGRWLAYSSNESGRHEIYVRPFPSMKSRWQVSVDGGVYPTWSRTKPELFYAFNGQIKVVRFAASADSFRAEKPRIWSNRRHLTRGQNRSFDLHPDGERFALAPITDLETGTTSNHVTFLFNFFDELGRLAPLAKR